MLFQPFEVLSVDPADASYLSSLAPSDCGVLCCCGGQGHISAGGDPIPFRQDSCLFLFPGNPLTLRMEEGQQSLFWIKLKINHVDLQQALSGRILRLPCKAAMLTAAARKADGPSGYETLNQILEMVLLDAVRQGVAPGSFPSGMAPEDAAVSPELHRLYSSLREYLERNLQSDFTAAQLAAAVGLSLRQLNAFLQKHSSCTAREFINDFRIQKATLLLLSSDKSITEIAGLSGFKTVHYFSRAFKKASGLSPQAFRASVAEQK